MNKLDVSVSIASGALSALIVDTFILGDPMQKNTTDSRF